MYEFRNKFYRIIISQEILSNAFSIITDHKKLFDKILDVFQINLEYLILDIKNEETCSDVVKFYMKALC